MPLVPIWRWPAPAVFPQLSLDCRNQRIDADDVQHPREIVTEHAQRHFGRDIGQRLHQKVRRTHPHLQRAERMLDGFAAHTHGVRIFDRAASARPRRRVRAPSV